MQFNGYEPCANPVVVRMLDGEEKVGMIHVPEAARQKTDFAQVVYSSDENFKPGDYVHLRGFSGAEFRFGEQDLVSVGLEEILGKLVTDGSQS